MGKHIVGLAVLSVTAVFIAFIAPTAVSSVDTDQAEADFGHTSYGWCGLPNPSGVFTFYDLTTHDVGLLQFRDVLEKWCEDHGKGAFMTTLQKDRILGSASAGVFDTTSASAFPTGWFEAPDDCVVLPTTGDGFRNRLQHVKQAEALELTLQILYDVGSNELSGITGAIVGTVLGVFKVTTFGWQWT